VADPPTHPDTGDDTAPRSGRGSTSGMPRWVKVFMIIVIVLVLAFVVSLLAGVRHGPGLHSPPGGSEKPAAAGHGGP
jgi:hypothetical protein